MTMTQNHEIKPQLAVVAAQRQKAMLQWLGKIGLSSIGAQLEKYMEAKCPMHRMAYHDQLTDLYNRYYFFERMKKEMARANEEGGYMGLVVADIDDFKKINDHYGHLAGDAVLVKMAQAVRDTQPVSGQAFPCRLGGEELIIILNQTTLQASDTYGERLCENIRRLHLVEYPDLHVTASIGIYTAAFPAYDGSLTIDKFIARADDQMYQAKRSGKNRFFSASLDKPIGQRLSA